MSFSMFCSLPLPSNFWNESSLNLVLPFFPLVGGFIGALWWGVLKLLFLSGLHIMPAAAILTLVPFAATGFLHLDGYMDTSDAVLSRRPPEEKLKILKDPHTGSFAVIMLAVLFLLQFSVLFVIVEKGKAGGCLIIIPVISRCCSSISIYFLKTMEQSGLAKMFKQNTGTRHKIFVIFIFVFTAALSYIFAGIPGFLICASVTAGFIAAMFYVYRDLNGVSGDLCGFSLVIGELCGLIALALI